MFPNRFSEEQIGHNLNTYARIYGLSHIQRFQKEPQEKDQQRIITLLEKFFGSPTNSSMAYRSWYGEFSIYKRFLSSHTIRELSKVEDLEPPSTANSAVCLYGLELIASSWWDSLGIDLSYLSR